MTFPASYAAIIAMAAGLMFLSSTVFVSMGEPDPTGASERQTAFAEYLREGLGVFHTNQRFRLFVFTQWCGGAVLMSMPFYVVQASTSGFDLGNVALLLGAQTAGALISNTLWGWWGDHLGKASLLEAIALGRAMPPLLILFLTFTEVLSANHLLIAFVGSCPRTWCRSCWSLW